MSLKSKKQRAVDSYHKNDMLLIMHKKMLYESLNEQQKIMYKKSNFKFNFEE